MAFLRYAGLYFSTPATTTLTAATPAKASGTTSLLGASGFTHANNRLTCTETQTRDYLVLTNLGVTKESGGSTLGFYGIYKNGLPLAGGGRNRSISNTSDQGSVSVSVIATLALNDYIEVWVGSDNGDNITVEDGTLTAVVAG